MEERRKNVQHNVYVQIHYQGIVIVILDYIQRPKASQVRQYHKPCMLQNSVS